MQSNGGRKAGTGGAGGNGGPGGGGGSGGNPGGGSAGNPAGGGGSSGGGAASTPAAASGPGPPDANGDPSPSTGGPKPGSAGATTRDAAQRLLALCQKSEWPGVDQLLKNLEKVVSSSGSAEEGVANPLAGVADPVSHYATEMCSRPSNRRDLA